MILLTSAAGWVLGLVLGRTFGFPFGVLLLLLAPPALALLLARHARPVLFVALLVLGLLGGLLRTEAASLFPQPAALEAFAGRTATVVGKVRSSPILRTSTVRVFLDVEQIEKDGVAEPVRGGTVAWLGPESATGVHPGDRLALTGRLELPPTFEDLDYRASLQRRGISVALYRPQVKVLSRAEGPERWLDRIRAGLARSLDRGLTEPQASLARALLLGQRDGLSAEVQTEWSRAGTVHILSISGLHIGVLLATSLGMAAALMGRRRQLHLLPPFVAIWAYAILAGLEPPIQRAALMGSVYLLAIALGRQSSGGLALLLAAAVLAGIDPTILSGVSFQLSFAAMAGLVYLAPRVQEILARALGIAEARGGLSGFLLMGTAAFAGSTLAIAPLLFHYFGMTSIMGLPATLLAVPVLSIQLMTTAFAALAGLFGGIPAQVGGWIAWPWLTYLLALSSAFARGPFAVVTTAPWSVWWVVVAYFFLAAAFWRPAFRRPAGLLGPAALGPGVPSTQHGGRILAVALSLLAVFATTALATTVVSLRNSGVLHVSVLDVGQGDAVLIRTPQGRQVLVDGGPNPLTLEQRLAEEVPWWSRRLDLVVLTHGQADHVGGLPDLLERRPVRAVLEPGLDAGNVPYLRWRDALVDGDPPVFRAAAATRVDLGGGVWLEVLHPPSQPIRSARSDLDDNSIVLRLTYGQATFLLPGDIFSGGESYLVAQGAPLRATVLKVPHHGSANASTAPFLEAVSPQVAVVSSGVENPFGHPSDEALSRLTARVGEDRLFRTDRHGTVRFTTDGKRLWVRTAR